MPTFTGTAGPDYLEGTTGADTLIGLAGDDIYIVDQSNDQVVEANGEGNDIVYTSTVFVLTPGNSVETLAARDNSLTTPIALTGNEIINILLGNNGNNYLDGGGGADILAGYGGNDTYVVDNSADAVFEYAGGGTDTIYTTVDYALASGQYVETLASRDNQASTAMNLFGNDMNNNILGNGGANFLDGGAGADVMFGYFGDDIYIIDNAGDRVYEANTAVTGPNTDIVYVTLSYSGSGGDVELVSTIDVTATTNIDIRWEGYGVDIMGNNGNNVLDAAQGRFSVMTGFGGADTFVTHGGGGTQGLLFISDFLSGTDKLRVTDLFTDLPTGAINPNVFVVGTSSNDFDDRFVYDPNSGLLAYDRDGAGPLGLGYIAGFFPGTTITAADIIIA